MGIFSTRRRQGMRPAKQSVVSPPPARQQLRDEVGLREVEFIGVIPAPPRPAPPPPKHRLVFVPTRVPFTCAPRGELRAVESKLAFGPDSFCGEVVDGMPSRGTWRFADGSAFEQGLGMAHVELDGGSHYFGQVVDGCACGEGMVRWFTGDTYTGAFSDGQPCGPGVWHFPDGHQFELPADLAVLRYEEGDAAGTVAYCTMQDGHVHGVGVVRRYDGGAFHSTYAGAFSNDKARGEGSMYYADGSIYRGEMLAGSRQGAGTLWTPFGRITGQWRQGELHGENCQTEIVGDDNIMNTVSGTFVDGRCVYGRQTRQGSPTYVGPFILNKDGIEVQHGGVAFDAVTGEKVPGEWENGFFIPPGWRELQAARR